MNSATITGRYADEHAELVSQHKREIFAAVMSGQGPFWPMRGWQTATDAPAFDGEQYRPVFVAVHRAIAADANDAQFRQIVMNAVRSEAERYAEIEATSLGGDI